VNLSFVLPGCSIPHDRRRLAALSTARGRGGARVYNLRAMHAIFASADTLGAALQARGYLADRPTAVSLFLAGRLGKPLLLEGPAGTGKTELAKALAGALGAPLIRLQCYEGLDEAKALYEWEYGKQLLYTQILREAIAGAVGQAGSLAEAAAIVRREGNVFFTRDFLLPRPLLAAILSPEPCVLLIDEIDRADEEFEAFLLEVLSDFQVSVPELGTLRAETRPAVVLTSNATRELSEALRRRCLYQPMAYPPPEREAQIIRAREPALPAQLVAEITRFVAKARALELRKRPSIAEALDWAAALALLHADRLAPELVRDTIGALLKDPADIAAVLRGRL
jgi:MoxR-like ATPase